MLLTNFNLLSITIFLVIITIIVYLFFCAYKNQEKINQIFKKLSKSKYFYLKYILLITSFLILLLSIFGIKTKQTGNDIKGIDIIFMLDVSKSMNVADIYNDNLSFTRLDFAKNAITDFVMNNTTNRYSLVIFAGDAISSIPLTNDTNIFFNTLQNVDYKNLITQSSDFVKAFELANNRTKISQNNSQAIIFISDGGDEDYNIDEKILKSIKTKDIEYFIAGIGTEKGGRIITGRDVFGNIIYQIYDGKYVISKLNETNLKKIAKIFSGQYIKLDKYSDINKFLKQIDKIDKKVIENNNSTNQIDTIRLLSFISFIFFMLYLTLYLFEEKIYFLKIKNG